MIVYFDDILVYNKRLNKYVNHLCFVLNVLRHEKLYTNLNNYTFCMDKVDILVYNKSLNKHVNYLCFMLNVLRNEKLYTNLNNYTFCKDKVIFLI
jgi:hypothetical protein